MAVLGGKVAIVTGASRGIGRGIALQLGQAGATVYITGRSLKPSDAKGLKGSLEDTAKEIENRGGRCIPVQCDHSKDDDVAKLFERVGREQDGQLDILVNNAYAGVHAISEGIGKPFWSDHRDAVAHWDIINNVGLRNHYVCTIHAARMMVPRKQGLIVNVSSPGGLKYLFDVPYGIGKAALDRMAADCGHELRKYNVTCISLWPSAVQTENVLDLLESQDNSRGLAKMRQLFEGAESTEVAGIAVVKLASDSNVHRKNGKIQLTGDLASEYSFTDVDGRPVPNLRSIGGILQISGWPRLGSYVPSWVRLPHWMLHFASYKF